MASLINLFFVFTCTPLLKSHSTYVNSDLRPRFLWIIFIYYDGRGWSNIHPRTFCRPLQISNNQVYYLQILSLSYLLARMSDSGDGACQDSASHLSYGKALADWIIFCIGFYLNRCGHSARWPSSCCPKELSSSRNQSNYSLKPALGRIGLFCPRCGYGKPPSFPLRIRRLGPYFCRLGLVSSWDRSSSLWMSSHLVCSGRGCEDESMAGFQFRTFWKLNWGYHPALESTFSYACWIIENK